VRLRPLRLDLDLSEHNKLAELPQGRSLMPRPFVFRPGDNSVDDIREWFDRPALRTLVERFGGSWPASDNITGVVTKLQAFSTIWDRRSGQSRLDLEQLDDDDERIAGLSQLVEELGLVTPAAPEGGIYDWILLLGGLATGCRARMEYCAELLAERSIEVGRGLCLLGSFRELHSDELLAASSYTENAHTEADLLRAMADRVLPSSSSWDEEVEGDPVSSPRTASMRAWRGGSVPLRLYASASSDPGNRSANTADTYLQFANDTALLPSSRLLLVTTHIYARYQHWDAVRTLGIPRKVIVETVGTPPAVSGSQFSPAWYLQEVRSAIRSAAALLEAIDS